MIWLIGWIISLIIFLLIPICCNPESRDEMWWRIRHCKWGVPYESSRNVDETNHSSSGEGAFHYVLSREQENEIREAFLVEKLANYTKTVTSSDVIADQPLEDAAVNDAVDREEDPEHCVDDKDTVICHVEPVGSGSAETGSSQAKKNSSDGDIESDNYSSDGGPNMDTWAEQHGSLRIPRPGECRHSLLPEGIPIGTRTIPNGCAICLCPFEVEERLSWSSNEYCKHVFHERCVLDWLMESGKKAIGRRRREEQQSSVVNYTGDPVLKLTKFPMLCPCCRRDFVQTSVEENDSTTKGETERSPTTSNDEENPPVDEEQSGTDE